MSQKLSAMDPKTRCRNRRTRAITSPASATSSPPRRCRVRCPQGQNSPQKVALWSVRRAAFRHRLHRAAPCQPPQLALPHPSGGGAQAVQAAAESRFHNRFRRVPATPNQLRWSPLSAARSSPPISSTACSPWPATAVPRRRTGVGIHVYAANRSMQGRFFYDADGELLIVPQQGASAHRHRTGRAGSRAAGNRGDPARHPLPRGVAGWQRARLRGAKISARRCACRNSGPSVPTALPTRGIFFTPVAAYEDIEGKFELVAKFQGRLWSARDRSFAAGRGRLARQPRAVQIRSAPLQHHRLHQLRSSRSIHLHGADFAERHARHRQHGFRDLPAALAGGGTHVPAALVPSQCRQRIHGPDPRRVRRQRRRNGGFVPGGASLHNCMSGHGPDAASYEKAGAADTRSRSTSPTPWPSCSRPAR